MILKQYIGPFAKGETIATIGDESLKNVTFLQLGVECPHSIPLSEMDLENDTSWPIRITINAEDSQYENTRDYLITDKDILELKIQAPKLTLKILKETSPYFIINAAYETAS